MQILLFIVYLLAACYLIPRLPFCKNSGLRPAFLIALFCLRIVLGSAHNYIAWRYFPHHGDIWLLFQHSFETRQQLQTGWHTFWINNNNPAYLQHNILEWMHMVFNLFSGSNLYINTLFFNFIFFSGYIALFSVVYRRLDHNLFSALPFLLLPSILFWTTCMYTEGLVLALLGWLFNCWDQSLTKGLTPARALLAILLILLIVFFRPVMAFGLLPILLLGRLLGPPLSRRQVRVFATLCCAILTGLVLYPPFLSALPHSFAAKQADFMVLQGNSRIPLPVLEPTWTSLFKIFPTALFNGCLQPLPGYGGQTIYLAFTAELLAIWCLALVALAMPLLKRRHPAATPSLAPSTTQSPAIPSSIPSSAGTPTSITTPEPQHPSLPPSSTRRIFPALCLILSLSGLLIIGYIIPFAGAIVRYRCLYLPFLLAPFAYGLRSYSPIRRIAGKVRNYIFI